MPNALPTRLQEQLDDLAMFADRTERIQALIGIAETFKNPGPDEVPRTPETRVPGCESEVFLHTAPDGNGLRFRYAVDNPQGISAMALAAILGEGLSSAPLEQVGGVPDDLIYTIFGKELSMGKSMGLINMLRMAKAAAQVAGRR